MKREELRDQIEPCSLLCYTCSAYEKGVIRTLSKELLHYPQGLAEFYQRHLPKEEQDYAQRFLQVRAELSRYTTPKCKGCRKGGRDGCGISNGLIPACAKAHWVDDCGECEAFPCEKTKELFEREVYEQWRRGNEWIREWGIEKYWEYCSNQSHYRAYCGGE